MGVAIDQAEVFRRATLVGKADFKSLEALIVAAAMYWALTAIFTVFQRRLESRDLARVRAHCRYKTEWRRKSTRTGVVVETWMRAMHHTRTRRRRGVGG